MWFSLFTPIMKAEDDGEGACRKQLWAELFFVLKHRMIFSEAKGGRVKQVGTKSQVNPKMFLQAPLIERDLFVIYAVDTMCSCNHPIIADLQHFVSFPKQIYQKCYEEKIL